MNTLGKNNIDPKHEIVLFIEMKIEIQRFLSIKFVVFMVISWRGAAMGKGVIIEELSPH